MNRIVTTAAAAIFAAGLTAPSVVSAAIAPQHLVKIHNDGSNDIYYVHITPVEWEDWGDDLLVFDVIEPGDDYAVDLARYGGACEYDVLITYDTQFGMEEVTLWGVNLCEQDILAATEWHLYTA